MSRKKRAKAKRKKQQSRERFTRGSVTVTRVGKRIKLRNRATPEEFAAMRKSLAEWKAGAPTEMRAESEELLALISDIDPLTLLGLLFAYHHLMPALAGEEMTKSYVLVEHLALLLAKESRSGRAMPTDGDTAQEVIESLSRQLNQGVQFALPDLPADGSPPENGPLRDALAAITSWEIGVRAERYDHQQKILLKGLFDPFASELRTALGFTCEDALKLEDVYIDRIKDMALDGVEKIQAIIQDTDRVLRGKSPQDQRVGDLVESIRAVVPAAEVRVRVMWRALVWNAFRTGHSIGPTLEDLRTETGLDAATIQALITGLTATAGDLGNYWYIIPVSPLKKKPLVEIGMHYVLPSPALFLAALQTLFEKALKGTADWERYQQHRSAYGVDRGAESFRRALPGAVIYNNLKYKSGSFEGDVDLMVIYEGHLFLIEVKSGDFADAARAGIETRVEGVLRDLVLKAHEQVGRAAAYLASAPTVVFKDGGNRVDIRQADFDHIHLMSLTLEQLGHVVNTAGAFIRSGARVPWSVSVDDLEAIADVLSNPASFLHYVARREVYLPHPGIQNGDELGFLEEYLRSALRNDPKDFGGYDSVMLDASSKTVDAFENAKGSGAVVAPPRQNIPEEVATLLNKLASDRPKGWLSASLTILNLIPRHQRVLARTLDKIARGVKVPGVTAKESNGETVACLRLDDPRLPGNTGEGTVLRVDANLNLRDLQIP